MTIMIRSLSSIRIQLCVLYELTRLFNPEQIQVQTNKMLALPAFDSYTNQIQVGGIKHSTINPDPAYCSQVYLTVMT